MSRRTGFGRRGEVVLRLLGLLRRNVAKLLPALMAGFLIWGLYAVIAPRVRWRRQARRSLKLRIVNYTVPFDDFKEHRGLIWLLNNLKVTPPAGRDLWRAEIDYVGYDPRDRDHPRRVSSIQDDVDVVYIADTYGVYYDDLKGAAERRAHTAVSPLLFGGLTLGDARWLKRFVNRGGDLIVEFNTLCAPTHWLPRREIEGILGVHWTGWVGRVFNDPGDEDDVPSWLHAAFVKSFPGRPFPTEPMLVLVRGGRDLVVLTHSDVSRISPRIRLNTTGRWRFPLVRGQAPYFYWFAVVEPVGKTRVLAELRLPDELLGAVAEQRLAAPPPLRVPLLTERTDKGRRIYMAADLADVDFVLPSHSVAERIHSRSGWAFPPTAVSSEAAFWRFYAPVVHQLLLESEARFEGLR